MTQNPPPRLRMQTGRHEEDVVRPRRAMLRGALAMGCCLLLPHELLAAPAKASKSSVQYQTHPKDDQKCGACMHFIAKSNTCKLVEGSISPNGWCVLWTKKA